MLWMAAFIAVMADNPAAAAGLEEFQAARLLRNPFQRAVGEPLRGQTPAKLVPEAAVPRPFPPLSPPPPPVTEVTKPLANPAPPEALRPVEPRRLPVLRGLLVAGERSAASVDGSVLLLGEELEGYRFTGVDGGMAILEREGRRLLVEVGKPLVSKTGGPSEGKLARSPVGPEGRP